MSDNKYTPKVESIENIINAPLVSSAGGFLVALPVVSNRGPLKPTLVDNYQFTKLFMDGEINRAMDISQILAYELSKSCNILVSRVDTNESKVAALSDGLGKVTGAKWTEDGITVDVGSHKFVVAAAYPSTQDYVRISIPQAYSHGTSLDEGHEPGVIIIQEYIGGVQGVTYNFQFSLREDAIDEYGQVIFLEEYNNKQDLVRFKVNVDSAGNVGAKEDFVDFGKTEGFKTGSPKQLEKEINAAIDKIADYDMGRVNILFDSGLTTAGIANKLLTVAGKLKALAVISHPVTHQSNTQVSDYVNTITGDKALGYMASPWNKDTSIADFVVKVPYSYNYILKIIHNKRLNREFAPVFGISHGSTSGTARSMTFTYTYRPTNSGDAIGTSEIVQKAGVNPVVYRESRGISFFVNNWTLQGKKDVMSNENLRRMWFQIQYDLNSTMEQFIGYPNDKATRQEVESAIDTYFKTVVDQWGWSVTAFRRRTTPYDPSRPSDLDVYVDIQFPGVIKWINVFHRSIPVIV